MICEEMPLGWNEKNASKLQYVHNLCPSLVSHMVFTSLGPFVYGHGELNYVLIMMLCMKRFTVPGNKVKKKLYLTTR